MFCFVKFFLLFFSCRFFVLLFVYLIAGLLYNKYRKGVQSLPEMVPNYSFWADFPFLVKVSKTGNWFSYFLVFSYIIWICFKVHCKCALQIKRNWQSEKSIAVRGTWKPKTGPFSSHSAIPDSRYHESWLSWLYQELTVYHARLFIAEVTEPILQTWLVNIPFTWWCRVSPHY